MAQRTIPRPVNPFLPPEMFNPAPIGAQPVPMQQPAIPDPLAGAPRRVPTTIEPMQGLGPMGAPQAAAASAMPMPGAAQGGGFMSNLKGGVGNLLGNPDVSLALASGLLGGGSTTEAIGRGFGAAGVAMARQKDAPATTDDITEFAFAKQQGYEGSFPDFLTMKKGGGSTPSDIQEYEYARQQGFDGSFTDYQQTMKKAGAQSIMVGDNMKLTEGQSKDVGFYARGRAADNELAPFEDQLASLAGSAASQIPLGDYLKTPEYQQAERAGRELLAVILRKDTGAAVTKQEFDLYGPMYLPQPGNDPATIKAKKKARAGALAAIKLGLGTARPLADEIDAELGPVPDAPAPATPGGWTVTPVP